MTTDPAQERGEQSGVPASPSGYQPCGPQPASQSSQSGVPNAMLCRVAEAICCHHGCEKRNGNASKFSVCQAHTFLDDARSAIAAMREPTKPMVDLAWLMLGSNLRYEEVYRHLIGAALDPAKVEEYRALPDRWCDPRRAASAIEARRTETGTGSVEDESAVGDSRDAQGDPS